MHKIPGTDHARTSQIFHQKGHTSVDYHPLEHLLPPFLAQAPATRFAEFILFRPYLPCKSFIQVYFLNMHCSIKDVAWLTSASDCGWPSPTAAAAVPASHKSALTNHCLDAPTMLFCRLRRINCMSKCLDRSCAVVSIKFANTAGLYSCAHV